MDEQIDIKFVTNAPQYSAESKKIESAIVGVQTVQAQSTSDMSDNIKIQKQVLKDLESQYKATEKAVKAMAPGAAQSAALGQLGGAKAEIEAERKALQDLETQQESYKKSCQSLRTQMMELRNAMAGMTEGTKEYAEKMRQLGELQDRYADIQKQGKIFSDDQKNIRTSIEAVQGLAGAMSVATGVASLFGASQENLAKIQAKLQSVMAISMGVNQIAQVLNKDSYVTHVLLTGAKNKLTIATTRLSLALGISNVAARALMITLTGGLMLAITFAIAAYDKWSKKQEENKKKIEETKKAHEDLAQSIASEAASELATFNKLQIGWNKLNKNVKERQKFIKENAKAFDDLGVSVSGVKDAENLFVNNSESFISSLMLRAQAAAYASLQVKKIEEAITTQQMAKTRGNQTTEGDIDDAWAGVAKKYLGGSLGKTFLNKIALAKQYNSSYEEIEKEVQQTALRYAKLRAKDLEYEAAAKMNQAKEMAKQEGDILAQAAALRNNAGITDKTVEKKGNNNLAKDAKDRQYAIEQARIDSINDGHNRRLAQIDLNEKKELDKLKDQKTLALKVASEAGDDKMIQQVTIDFKILESAANDKAMRERLAVTKDMQDEIVDEITKSGDLIVQQLDHQINDEWEYLQKYGTVAQKKLAIIMLYNEKIAAAKTEGQKKSLAKEKDESIKDIDIDAIRKSSPFNVLMDNLDKSAIPQINNAIAAAKMLLDAAAKSGKYTAQDLQAMYGALGKAETEVRKRNPFAALGAAVKNWDKTDPKQSFTTLSSAASASFGLIGDSLGIVVGGLKEMGLAGDEETERILDSTVKLIGGLGDIAGGFASMNPVQMLQGVMSVITSLWDLLDNQSREARYEIVALQGRIDALEKSYEALEEAIGKAYSSDAANLIKQSDDLLEKQRELIEQQKEAEKSKKKPDDSALDDYDKKIEEINKKLEENKEKAIDAIFGSDVKSEIDNFASAYMDMWDSGEDRATSQKEVVRKMIKGIIQEMVKSDIAGQVKAMREKIAEFMTDDMLSDSELEQINDMGDAIFDTMEKRGQAYDKILKEDVKNENSLTGQIRGSIATEASVDQLGGLFRSQTDSLLRIDTKMDLGFGQLVEIARSNAAIEANTAMTAANTAQTVTALASGFASMQSELQAINKNTSKDSGSYGN